MACCYLGAHLLEATRADVLVQRQVGAADLLRVLLVPLPDGAFKRKCWRQLFVGQRHSGLRRRGIGSG